jgi:hypothetical protein
VTCADSHSSPLSPAIPLSVEAPPEEPPAPPQPVSNRESKVSKLRSVTNRFKKNTSFCVSGNKK